MFEKRELIISQGENLLQNLVKKIGKLVFGGNIREDRNEKYKCVTENWMSERTSKIGLKNGLL